MKPLSALFVTMLIVSPLPALAQEQAEENPVAIIETELLGLLKVKGFDNAKAEQIRAVDDAIVIEGLSGAAGSSAFKFGRIEVKGIDAGYRWTRAKQVSFSNVDIAVGTNSFHAEALLSNGFGILDVDSGQPSFAFDELAVVNGNWKQAGVSLVSVSSLVAKGRQWKELYSIPATLDLKATATFSGQALLVLLGQMPFSLDVAEPAPQGEVHTAEVTARMSSTTSTGSLAATLQVKTDQLGTHKIETMIGGFDDGLLGSYFGRGDENVTGNDEKLTSLKAELDRQIAEVSVKSLFYQGDNLPGLGSVLSKQHPLISSITDAWVRQNSSEKNQAKNIRLIAEPVGQFLASPNRVEIDVIPERGTTLSTLAGAMDLPEDANRKLLDVLGMRVIAK